VGVVKQPMKGAEERGVVGFAEGLGKGLLGLAVKPAVGAVDLITLSTQGISNTTSYFENKDRERWRKPRFFDERKIVLPYDKYSADGQYLFYKIPEENIHKQIYHYHIEVKDEAKKAVAILSNQSFYYILKPAINLTSHKYIIKHSFDLSYLHNVTLSDQGLTIEYFNSKSLELGKVMVKSDIKQLKSFMNTLLHLYNSLTKGDMHYEINPEKPTTQAIELHSKNRGLKSDFRLIKEGGLTVAGKDQHCIVKHNEFISEHKKQKMSLPGALLLPIHNTKNNTKNNTFSFLIIARTTILRVTTYSLKERQAWLDVCLLNGAKLKTLK